MTVSVRGGFSDRNGVNPINTEMQIDDFDYRTRTIIHNTIDELIDLAKKYEYKPFFEAIYIDAYLNERQKSYPSSLIKGVIFETIRLGSFDEILTIIEFFCNNYPVADSDRNALYKMFNGVFEKEYVGYRFVGNQISKITDEIEIEEVNLALNSIDEVRQHIEKAQLLLSNRENPDYENSIKESITAVEAECNIILGKKSTLSEALNRLENSIVIHPALKSAYNSIYGYCSDASGVRHAGSIGGPESTFEEARYMLVSCSAFINYLKSCSAKM